MTDIFLTEDVQRLFKGKHVVFMGDSNIRALYKDMLCLSEKSKFISLSNLKSKMPNTVHGDELVYHGPLCNGRNYREEREKYIKKDSTKYSYFFLTRVFDSYVESVLQKITAKQDKPDVVIVNSSVWDISRWGPNGIKMYRENLVTLMKKFQKYLPKNCLVIWVTTPPISCEMKGGFLVKQLEFLKYSLRFHVVESNYYARKVVVSHGYDVLDFHYHLRMQLHRRDTDGVHWFPDAVRYLLNLLLTHISLAWGEPLPHRYDSVVVQRTVNDVINQDEHANCDKRKQVKADVEQPHQDEQKPAEKKMKHVRITAPSPSTPRRSSGKENAHVKRKKGKSQGQNSIGCFMKKLQFEERHKKRVHTSAHQSNYVNNFVPNVKMPLLMTPAAVSLTQNSHFLSPRFSTAPNSRFLSPYSPSQPFLLQSPSRLFSRYSPSHPTPCTPPQTFSPYSPARALSPYSPYQPLNSYVNNQFDHARRSFNRPPNNCAQQGYYKRDAITYSPSYFSFEV